MFGRALLHARLYRVGMVACLHELAFSRIRILIGPTLRTDIHLILLPSLFFSDSHGFSGIKKGIMLCIGEGERYVHNGSRSIDLWFWEMVLGCRASI